MTQRERIQWLVLVALVLGFIAIFVWNAFLPGSGESGRIPVIDEVLRRQR